MLEFGSTDPDHVRVEVAGLGLTMPIADGEAAVAGAVQEGRDGWLFLRLGTNEVIRFFTEADYFSASDVERWCDLLVKRGKRMAELQTRYFHFIVPDKLTVYRDNYIGSLNHYDNRPSRTIPLALDRRGASHIYIDITSSMIAERDWRPLFYKTDTHWTPFGALIAYRQLCKAPRRHRLASLATRGGAQHSGGRARGPIELRRCAFPRRTVCLTGSSRSEARPSTSPEACRKRSALARHKRR
jgi:SGNH hydrolase-like domain, acetyltransferase AlgX